LFFIICIFVLIVDHQRFMLPNNAGDEHKNGRKNFGGEIF
jgi:hypothetical protein